MPANTVKEAGFEPFMAAIAQKQQWVADQARAGVFNDVVKDARWQVYADRLIADSLSKVATHAYGMGWRPFSMKILRFVTKTVDLNSCFATFGG